MHLFTLYAIIQATSPMSHIASLVACLQQYVLYHFVSSLYYLLEIKVLLLLLPDLGSELKYQLLGKPSQQIREMNDWC